MWNSNCVPRHKLEITQFLIENHTEVIPLAKTHLTSEYNFQIREYTLYCKDHTDGKAYGESGILVMERIKHHFHQRLIINYLQATSIILQSGNNSITIAAVYYSPRFTITEGKFFDFFNSLGVAL